MASPQNEPLPRSQPRPAALPLHLSSTHHMPTTNIPSPPPSAGSIVSGPSAREQLIGQVEDFRARNTITREAYKEEALRIWNSLHEQYGNEITALSTLVVVGADKAVDSSLESDHLSLEADSTKPPDLYAWTFRRWATSSNDEGGLALHDDCILDICEAAFRSQYKALSTKRRSAVQRLCGRWRITVWELYLEFGPNIVQADKPMRSLTILAKCFEQDSFRQTAEAILRERIKRAQGEKSRSTTFDMSVVATADVFRAELAVKGNLMAVSSSQIVTRSQGTGQHFEAIPGQTGVVPGAGDVAFGTAETRSGAVDADSGGEQSASSSLDVVAAFEAGGDGDTSRETGEDEHDTGKFQRVDDSETGKKDSVNEGGDVSRETIKDEYDDAFASPSPLQSIREDTPSRESRVHAIHSPSTRPTRIPTPAFKAAFVQEDLPNDTVLSPEIGRNCRTELPDLEEDFSFGDIGRWKHQETAAFSSPFQFDFRNRTVSQGGSLDFEAEDAGELFGADESSEWESVPPSSASSNSPHLRQSFPLLLDTKSRKRNRRNFDKHFTADRSPIIDTTVGSHDIKYLTSQAPDDTKLNASQKSIARPRSPSTVSVSSFGNGDHDQEPLLEWTDGRGGQIRAKDLATLADGNWVNDEIINYAAYQFTQPSATEVPRTNDSDIFVESSFFYANVAKAMQTEVRPELFNPRRKPHLSDVAHYVIPINRSNTHWLLVVISHTKSLLEEANEKPSILFVDPLDTGANMNKANTAIVHNLQGFIQQFIKSRTGHEPSDTMEVLHAKNITQQHNSYDCGIFLLQYLRRFRENPDTFIDQVRRFHGTIDVGDTRAFRAQLRESISRELESAVKNTTERASSSLEAVRTGQDPIDQEAQDREVQMASNVDLEAQSPRKPTVIHPKEWKGIDHTDPQSLKRKQVPDDQQTSQTRIEDYQAQMDEFTRITETHYTLATQSLAAMSHKECLLQGELDNLDADIKRLSDKHTESSGLYDCKRRQETSLQAFVTNTASGITPDLAPFGISEFLDGLASQLTRLTTECEAMSASLQMIHQDLLAKRVKRQECEDLLHIVEGNRAKQEKLVSGLKDILELQGKQKGILDRLNDN